MSEQELTPEQIRQNQRLRRMGFWKHMEELRKRLLRVVIGVVVASIVSLIFTKRFLVFILAPLGEYRAVALHPTETIVIYFRVGLLLGVVIAMPFILFQLLGFITPGLSKGEKRILLVSVFAIGMFFALGVAFAGGVMVPLSIKYLRGFLADMVAPTYSIDGYVSFVTTVMFSAGLIFQTPLLLALLARLGLVTSKQLQKQRRYALLLFAVVAAIITPTPDAFNMLMVMAPLLVLYEVGVLLAWFAGRARERALAATPA